MEGPAYGMGGPRPLDMVEAVAEALGALGPRVGTELFERRLDEALAQWGKAKAGRTWSCLFLKEAARALREALDDHAAGRDEPQDSLAYCVSETADQKRWERRRQSLGLEHDDKLAALAAKALWRRGVLSTVAGAWPEGQPGAWSGRFGHALHMAECLARVPGLGEEILEDLASMKPKSRMPNQEWGSDIWGWPIDPVNGSEMSYPKWVVAACAKEVQPERRGFPWGVWLALALPDKVDSWGRRLAQGSAGEDVELLRAMESFKGEGEIWQDIHREDCARAAARLERAAIGWGLLEGGAQAPGGAARL